MHKLPGKITRGWRRHAEAHNSLVDYVHKTHPIPAHGHRETVNGTMPPPRPEELVMQFTPRIFAGHGVDKPTISITPGYVFGAHGAGEHLPQVQAWVHEPTITTSGGQVAMTADPQPGMALTKGATNFIYLNLVWSAVEGELGGHVFETSGGTTSYAFPVDWNLRVTNLPTGTDATVSCSISHTHPINTGGVSDVVEGVSAEGRPPGAWLLVSKLNYILGSASFAVSTTDLVETELRTNILAGYVHLDDNGDITPDGDDDGLRWFLQGALWLSRPPMYITGHTDPARTEPVAPTPATGNTIPGIA